MFKYYGGEHSDPQFCSMCLCVCVLPGVVVTSLSRVKSSSRVGGWCWRGQFDTAAVSCSSNKIHTWIRPAGQKTHTAGVRERGESVREEQGGSKSTKRDWCGLNALPVSSSNSCRIQSIPSSVLIERSCDLIGRLASRAPKNTGLDGIL